MSSSKPKRSERAATNNPATGEVFAEALQKIEENELRALIFGYLAAKEAREPSKLATGLEQPPDPLDAYGDTNPTSAPGAPFSLSTSAHVDFLETFSVERADAVARDVTGDVVRCIFSVFSRNGIPVTTGTVPSTIMAMGNWISIGRAIYQCIVQKYPEFTQYAQPTTLARFYGHPLFEFAKAIRAVIK